MGKEFNREKKFSEDVERLLAGKEAMGGRDADEDYRTAIDFAKRLATEFRADPSPSFKASLKERLLQGLARKEAEAQQKEKRGLFWEGLRSLVPQNPVWRNATATVIMMLLTVGVLWGTGVFTPLVTTPQQDIVPPQDFAPQLELELELGLEAAADKAILLNQTQTAGGLSITLERVVLSSEGITFAAFATPTDYSQPRDSQGVIAPAAYSPAVAEYTANGITGHAGYAEVTYTESGIQLTWVYTQPYLQTYLESLPSSNVGELVFVITSFGDWQGPWEFSVPLQD